MHPVDTSFLLWSNFVAVYILEPQRNSEMALNAYLRLVGSKSAEIKGSVTQAGSEGRIAVIAVNHEIISLRDEAGLPVGKHNHKPFVITKELDISSPHLYTLLLDNENIPEWELKFWRPSKSGTQEQHYTIRLINAKVSSIEFRMDNIRHPDLMKNPEYEVIFFTYENIEWTWNDGGVTAMGNWLAEG